MYCALYTELLAHSRMSNEEYHFMASASGLVYIMASMLWEGMLRGGQLLNCVSQMQWYYSNTIFPAFRSPVLEENNHRVNKPYNIHTQYDLLTSKSIPHYYLLRSHLSASLFFSFSYSHLVFHPRVPGRKQPWVNRLYPIHTQYISDPKISLPQSYLQHPPSP